MKILKNIVSLLLVLTISNTVIGKTVHELFFHHHEVECSATATQHFHEISFDAVDLVCSFNFSASFVPFMNASLHYQLFEANRKIEFFYKVYSRNIFFNILSLRGPPTVQ